MKLMANDPVEYKLEEALPNLIPYCNDHDLDLEKYFDYFASHSSFEDFDSILPNSLLIYCSFPNPSSWTATLELKMDLYISDSIFFDWQRPFNAEITADWRLKLNGRFLGYYFKEKNILTLVDITHMNAFIPSAFELLKKLIEDLGIKKVKKVKKMKKKKERIEFKLGTDPEFLLVKNGRIVCAENYYSSISREIGCDGAGYQLEIRPKPDKDPKKVVKHIKDLFKRIKEEGYSVALGGTDRSLGGHIHIGVGRPFNPHPSFINALDHFFYPTARMVYRSGYGSKGDWRQQPHGLEYRTPSAMIFCDPKIAETALQIVKRITQLAIREAKIKLPKKLSEESFRAIRLEKCAKIWLDFIENHYKYDKENFLAYWKIEKETRPRKTYPLGVVFRDEWDITVQETVSTLCKKARFRNPVFVTLFGLHERRGDNNTIPLGRYGVIEHEKARINWIGLCKEVRFNRSKAGWLAKEIIKYAHKNLERG